MRRLLPIIAMLMLAPSAKCQISSFYTVQILGINPINAPGQTTPTPIFLAYAPTRVCTLPLTQQVPCLPLAVITDGFGNTISNSIGGAFGQISTDVTGRILFGCVANTNYQIQTAATGTTPTSNYPISCPGSGINPSFSTLTVTGTTNLNGTTNINAGGTFAGSIVSTGNQTETAGQNQYSMYSLNGKVIIDNNKYPCTGAGLNSAIAALPAGGGTVDATACTTPNTIGATVLITNNNVIILLGPYLWTTTVYPAFKIQSVTGSKIIGYYGDTPNAGSPSGSVGTIVRSVGTLTATSDLIDVIGSTSTEVGGMVLDFGQATPASGQYGVYSSSLLHEYIHDIEVYNAGVDCYRWDTANGGPTYDTIAKNLRCQTASTEGFMLLSQNASGNDLARWHCINCSFVGVPLGSSSHFGSFGFHYQIPSSNGQILGDITCERCFANETVSGVNNAGLFLDQAGSVHMYDITFTGGLEDTSAANAGSAIRAATGTACGIDGVYVQYGQANFTTSDNLTANSGVCTVIDQFQAASGSGTRLMALSRLKINDQGSCTMAAGTCTAQNLVGTYSAAPNCFATWNGSGTLTGILKAPSTTTTVTPASSVNTDTAVVNWSCLGN